VKKVISVLLILANCDIFILNYRIARAMVVDLQNGANATTFDNNLITVDIWGETITQLTFDDILVFACLEVHMNRAF
jgi:hypothetical protein